MHRILLAWLVVVALAAGSSAQTPSAPGAPASADAAAVKPAGQADPAAKPSSLEPQGFSYEPENRRDPFVSLLRRGGDPTTLATGAARPPGLAGLTADEIALRGVMRGATGQWVAYVQGVDRRMHLAKAGDKLLDGTVQTVTQDSMVILQRVNDPLSLATQREVRKVLRQEEAK